MRSPAVLRRRSFRRKHCISESPYLARTKVRGAFYASITGQPAPPPVPDGGDRGCRGYHPAAGRQRRRRWTVLPHGRLGLLSQVHSLCRPRVWSARQAPLRTRLQSWRSGGAQPRRGVGKWPPPAPTQYQLAPVLPSNSRMHLLLEMRARSPESLCFSLLPRSNPMCTSGYRSDGHGEAPATASGRNLGRARRRRIVENHRPPIKQAKKCRASRKEDRCWKL